MPTALTARGRGHLAHMVRKFTDGNSVRPRTPGEGAGVPGTSSCLLAGEPEGVSEAFGERVGIGFMEAMAPWGTTGRSHGPAPLFLTILVEGPREHGYELPDRRAGRHRGNSAPRLGEGGTSSYSALKDAGPLPNRPDSAGQLGRGWGTFSRGFVSLAGVAKQGLPHAAADALWDFTISTDGRDGRSRADQPLAAPWAQLGAGRGIPVARGLVHTVGTRAAVVARP